MRVKEYVTGLGTVAGLSPVAVENETSATLRVLNKLYENQKINDEMQIYINFGESSTSLYLYNVAERIPTQVHNFAIGRGMFVRDIQGNLTLTPEQVKEAIEKVGFLPVKAPYDLPAIISAPFNEFVEEIKRFLMSSKETTTKNISKIYIFGEGSKFAGIDKKLAESLAVPVEMFNIMPYFKKNTVAEYFAHDWNVLVPAVGGCLP